MKKKPGFITVYFIAVAACLLLAALAGADGILLIIIAVSALIFMYPIHGICKVVGGAARAVGGALGVSTARRAAPPPAAADAANLPNLHRNPGAAGRPHIHVEPPKELMAQISKKRAAGIITCIAFILVAVVLFALFVTAWPWIYIVSLVLAAFGAGAASSALAAASQLFKTGVVDGLLRTVFDDVEYKKDSLDITGLSFFAGANRYSGADYIKARYKGRDFEQSDNEAYNVQVTTDKDGKTKETVTKLWLGRVMRFDNQTQFDEPVQVASKDMPCVRARDHKPAGWQKVETEMADFNAVFDVFTTTPLTAMAILTPPMIEGIMRLNAVLDRPMAACFENDKMYLLVTLGEGENPFEISPGRSNRDELDKLGGDIGFILDILENMYFKS